MHQICETLTNSIHKSIEASHSCNSMCQICETVTNSFINLQKLYNLAMCQHSCSNTTAPAQLLQHNCTSKAVPAQVLQHKILGLLVPFKKQINCGSQKQPEAASSSHNQPGADSITIPFIQTAILSYFCSGIGSPHGWLQATKGSQKQPATARSSQKLIQLQFLL